MFIKYLELCVCNMVSSIRSECNIEKEKKIPAKMMYDIFNYLKTQLFIINQEYEIQSYVVLIHCEVNRNMMMQPMLIMMQTKLIFMFAWGMTDSNE